ncbi:unnamed protein product [Schistosoma rodhaini]|nr:unnamed protein product [Schistosoma rodhaini]
MCIKVKQTDKLIMKCFSSVFSQSSLVPLAKIANAPSRSLRILWAIVTAIMFIGLCVCISLVVMQYLKHQTVFQLDYSGRHTVYDQVPGITICPQSQESKRLFLDAMKRLNIITQPIPLPWFSKTVMDQLRMKVIEIQPDLKFGIIVHRLPKGELLWNTSKTAISPIYRMLLNFSVEFQIQPSYLADSYRLTVMEQVPNIRNFLCTTFELRSNNVEKSWSYLEIRINQESTIENSNRVTFIIITHERGELPFSAYDRHIHTNLPPDTSVSLYFSKSVTTRLNTGRNPCHVGADAKFIASALTMDTEEERGEEEEEEQKHGVMGRRSHNSTILNEINDYDLSTITNNRNNHYDHNNNDNSNDNDNHHQHQWYLDYLDTIRMKNKQQTFVSDTTNYLQFALKRLKQKTKEQYLSQTNTVSLFGTEFLYSREACGWVECCTKVAYHCNCTCTLDLLSINRTALQTHFLCERTQCQDEQIPYETCPLPCIQTKFIKHSEVRLPGYEDGLPILTSRLKLVRSESVQVAMEEEIFSLAKLFSEVGGLCSLFIGFSCIFLFELLEALILMYYPSNKYKKSIPFNTINNNNNTNNSNNSNNNNNNTNSNITQSDIHKMNDQKCLTTPFIQANRHITDIIPNVNIDSMMNSTITTITTTNICNDISSENNNHKFSYSDNRIKANVSSANDASMEEYIDNGIQFTQENLHFNDSHIDNNNNNNNNDNELRTMDQSKNDPHLSSYKNNYHIEQSIGVEHSYNCNHTDTNHNNNNNNNDDDDTQEHTLSLSNQYEHNLNDINGSNHLYILPIWLSTNIPLHIIQNRQNDNIRKSFQIKSNNSKQLTNSLDHNNKLQEEGDEEGEECVYGETTTICSREELIKLLQQNRIRIKVM